MELYHYGIKGMRWGVRRTPEQLGHKTGSRSRKGERLDRIKSSAKKAAVRTYRTAKVVAGSGRKLLLRYSMNKFFGTQLSSPAIRSYARIGKEAVDELRLVNKEEK